jgi:transcription antitermination factor NusG
MQFSTNQLFDTLPAAPAWFAVYTKHQHEKKTAELLSNKGIEVFLPLYQAAHRWKDRTKILSLPLFPSYLFLHSHLQNKTEILNTPGIFFLVQSAGRACSIPPSEIEAIRKIGQIHAQVEPHPYLESGDSVRVKSGALTGLTGILTRIKNQYRIVLSVSLLQRSLSIEIDICNVEKTNPVQNRTDIHEFRRTA